MADGLAKTEVLFVRVTPAQKAQLDERVKQTGKSGSVLVGDALRQFLSNSPATEGAGAEGAAEETVAR